MAHRLVKHTYVILVTGIVLTIRYGGFRLMCVSCFVMPSSFCCCSFPTLGLMHFGILRCKDLNRYEGFRPWLPVRTLVVFRSFHLDGTPKLLSPTSHTQNSKAERPKPLTSLTSRLLKLNLINPQTPETP